MKFKVAVDFMRRLLVFVVKGDEKGLWWLLVLAPVLLYLSGVIDWSTLNALLSSADGVQG